MVPLRAFVVCLGFLVMFAAGTATGSSDEVKMREFARCLTDKGAVFYGAFWCRHCAEQKELFGDAVYDVKYVECGVVGNPRAQTPACSSKQIRKYPTWEFADGERREGKMSLEALAEKTGCKLP